MDHANLFARRSRRATFTYVRCFPHYSYCELAAHSAPVNCSQAPEKFLGEPNTEAQPRTVHLANPSPTLWFASNSWKASNTSFSVQATPSSASLSERFLSVPILSFILFGSRLP